MGYLRHPGMLGLLTAACVTLCAAGGVLAGPPGGYYDSVDDTDADTLRATLHDVIDDHVRFPYTSFNTDTWDILKLADEDPNDSGRILDVYKNASYPKFTGGNDFYNREHTWPNSYGFPDNTGDFSNYPYSDCHQLFLSDIGYNSARANHPFRNCHPACVEYPTVVNNGAGGGSGEYPGNSNWQTGVSTQGTWEAWLARRGDMARAMFYMDVRYEGGTHGDTDFAEPDLILTDDEALIDASDTGQNESLAYMGLLCALLQWHAQDPVDALEEIRNDIVFSFQDNRNPFVDHPEWAAVLFAGQCENGCVDPSDCDDGLFCNGAEDCVNDFCEPGASPCPGQGCDEDNDVCTALPKAAPWINEFHYDNSGTDAGEFLEIAGPAGLSLEGWSVHGYNGSTGQVYNTVLLSGTLPDQGGCLGTLAFSFVPMQNGSPDGLALVDSANEVVEFISYEGAFTAANGPAAGMMSADVGVFEPNFTPLGFSLQLAGTGAQRSDFAWQPAAPNTQDAPNTGQTFDGCEAECPADFDGDGAVTAADLAMLLGSWGPCPGCPADFDDDGSVGAADLAQLLGAWGDCL